MARVYFLLDRYADSAILLQKLIEATPDHVEYWRNLILALESDAKIESGLIECHKAIERFSKDASLYRQLGDLCKAKDDWHNAADAYRNCFELDETREDARKLQIAMLRRVGNRDAIRDALDQWLQASPNHPIAVHLRGAYSVSTTPTRASDDYVREVFDQFADTFDSQLTALQYQAPRDLADHLLRLPLPKDGSLRVLDAGCGTGLLGTWLRPYAEKLIGIDLSSQMLARAEKLQLYDELSEAELTAYLGAMKDAFDLIASTDTLNYFGDLRMFFLAARKALRSAGGWLVFTLESSSKTGVSSPSNEQPEYSLEPSGRYTHSIERIVEILKTSSFDEIEVVPCVIRQEAGKDAPGVIISCKSGTVDV